MRQDPIWSYSGLSKPEKSRPWISRNEEPHKLKAASRSVHLQKAMDCDRRGEDSNLRVPRFEADGNDRNTTRAWGSKITRDPRRPEDVQKESDNEASNTSTTENSERLILYLSGGGTEP